MAFLTCFNPDFVLRVQHVCLVAPLNEGREDARLIGRILLQALGLRTQYLVPSPAKTARGRLLLPKRISRKELVRGPVLFKKGHQFWRADDMALKQGAWMVGTYTFVKPRTRKALEYPYDTAEFKELQIVIRIKGGGRFFLAVKGRGDTLSDKMSIRMVLLKGGRRADVCDFAVDDMTLQ